MALNEQVAQDSLLLIFQKLPYCRKRTSQIRFPPRKRVLAGDPLIFVDTKKAKHIPYKLTDRADMSIMDE